MVPREVKKEGKVFVFILLIIMANVRLLRGMKETFLQYNYIKSSIPEVLNLCQNSVSTAQRNLIFDINARR